MVLGDTFILFCFSGGQNYYRGGNSGDTATSPHHFKNSTDTTTVSFTHSGIVRTSTFNVVSDGRIKKDIVDIDDEDGLNKILLVQPKKYKYIDETRGTHNVIGFIGQQIKEIIPETVQVTLNL